MKTRFYPILKIKKDILNNIEKELIKINQKISIKENEISMLKEELKNMKAPSVSVYRELLTFKDSAAAFLDEISKEQNLLEMMYSSRIDINKKYKMAMIEYEKINYLHTEELKLRVDKLRKEEQKFIDEVGGILYHQKNIH